MVRLPKLLPLPERVVFQIPPNTQTASGGWTDTWSDAVTNVPAMITPISTGEFALDDKIQTEMMYQIIIPADTKGVTDEQRIIWKTKTLYITGIMPEIANNGIQLITARERKYTAEE
jgi:SPP1 family predicted phage head-tail adaptor